jgi:hypothetical protein
MTNELKPCPTPRCHGVIFTIELVGGIGFKACCAGCEKTGPIGGSVCESTEFWNELPRKIKLTKTLPSEVGQYYWSEGSGFEVDISDVFFIAGSLFIDRGEGGSHRVERMGGYWAKVEQDQFEFEV